MPIPNRDEVLTGTGVRVAKWNPVLELHQPLRLCRPPPELIGQRDKIHMRGRINYRSAGCSSKTTIRMHHPEFGQEAGSRTRTVSVTGRDATNYNTFLIQNGAPGRIRTDE